MKVKLCWFVELLNEERDNKALPDRQTDDFTLGVNKSTVHFTAAILSLSISLGAVNVLFIKDEHRNHIVCHQIVEFTFGWFSTSATPFNNEVTIAWPLLICSLVLLNFQTKKGILKELTLWSLSNMIDNLYDQGFYSIF